MIESLLELEDITLIPSVTNKGWCKDKIDISVLDESEVTGVSKSLPIFTSPMDSIIDKDNWKVWQDSGIKPIIPRTEDLNTRLDACCFIFSAFSIEEVKQYFLDNDKRGGSNQYHICIDSGNGHDTNLISIGANLKRLYGKQIILMGGNIGNPGTYLEYAKAGFDYIRIGIASGSLVNQEKFGFHYPMASLLSDIQNLKKGAGIGLRPVKIIADGGIRSHSDVLKAMALGADYVMIGRQFASLLEAAGTIYRKTKSIETGEEILDEVTGINDIAHPDELEVLDLIRLYQGNTTLEMQALRYGYSDVHRWKKSNNWKLRLVDSGSEWVKITTNLYQWLEDFKEVVKFGFMMSGASNWKEYKENIKIGKL